MEIHTEMQIREARVVAVTDCVQGVPIALVRREVHEIRLGPGGDVGFDGVGNLVNDKMLKF